VDYDIPHHFLMQPIAETRTAHNPQNSGTFMSRRNDGSTVALQYNYDPIHGRLMIVVSQPAMNQNNSWTTYQQINTYGDIDPVLGNKTVEALIAGQGQIPAILDNLTQTGFACIQSFYIKDKGRIGQNDAQIAISPKGAIRFYLNGTDQTTTSITYQQAVSTAQRNCQQSGPAQRQAR
jgi:hypothetical protein